MTTAGRPIAETVMKMPPLSQSLPYALGGLGLAAMENKFIAPDLGPELKKVNLGIGGITGYLLSSPDPKVRFAALAMVPTKQLGLFGISAADKLRLQQQALVDANLGIANLNQRTAQIQQGNAASAGRLALMFLLPALAAGGAIGYMGYERYKTRNRRRPRYRTTSETGTRRSGPRVRIDIPATAMPKEFFSSLPNIDDSPRAHTRIMEQVNGTSVPTAKAAAEILEKEAATESASIPRLLGSLAAEFTGVPGATRTMKDIGLGLGNYSADRFGDSARYGASAAGNALLTLLTLRTATLPILGKFLGRRYLAHQARGMPGVVNRRSFPTFARQIYPYAYGQSLGPRTTARGGTMTSAQRRGMRQAQGLSTKSPMARLTQMRGRVDPNLFAWNNPTSTNPIFRRFLTNRGAGSATIPGQLTDTLRYGGNRALNALYRARKFGVRHPIISALAVGLPLVGMGSLRDETNLAQSRQNAAAWDADWKNKRGPGGMPVSAALSGVMQALGGPDPRASVRRQLEGAPWDPWATMRR